MTPARDLAPGQTIRLPQFRHPLTVQFIYSGPNTSGYIVMRLEGEGRMFDHWSLPSVEFEVVG